MLAKCEIRGVFAEWQVVEECPQKKIILFLGIFLSFGQFASSLVDLNIEVGWEASVRENFCTLSS